jgi:hypothetical protein
MVLLAMAGGNGSMVCSGSRESRSKPQPDPKKNKTSIEKPHASHLLIIFQITSECKGMTLSCQEQQPTMPLLAQKELHKTDRYLLPLVLHRANAQI